MKNTNAVRTEIHYAQVGEYQLPLLTLPQTDDTEPLGKYGRMRLVYLKNQRPVLYNQLKNFSKIRLTSVISSIWMSMVLTAMPSSLTRFYRRSASLSRENCFT